MRHTQDLHKAADRHQVHALQRFLCFVLLCSNVMQVLYSSGNEGATSLLLRAVRRLRNSTPHSPVFSLGVLAVVTPWIPSNDRRHRKQRHSALDRKAIPFLLVFQPGAAGIPTEVCSAMYKLADRQHAGSTPKYSCLDNHISQQWNFTLRDFPICQCSICCC